MSSAFTAQNGQVVFEGRPVRDMTMVAVKSRMIRLALDLKQHPDAAEMFWSVADQAQTAMNAAREQRKAQ